MSLLEQASLVVTPNGYKASKLYSVIPSTGAGDMDVVRATTATRVNSSGLIESVGVNIPRIDYTNGSCPSILVEPQRTNLVLYSQEFDNIAWTKFSSTVTTNSVISPDGTQNADTATFTGDINSSVLRQSILLTIGSTYTFSIYARTPSGTGTMSIDLGDGTNVTRTINSSWNRYTFTLVAGAFPHIDISSTTASTYYLWGAQAEAGSYATSYIPTTSASITRNADVISKTGISSLIGQTEGTIFVEEVYDSSVLNSGGLDDTLISLTDGTSNNLISIFHYGGGIGTILFFIRLSNTTQVAISSSKPTSGTYKIALAYKNNDVVGYINGIQIGTDTSATIPTTSVVTFYDPITTNSATKTVNIKSAQLYKTRLTNTELAQLTTI